MNEGKKNKDSNDKREKDDLSEIFEHLGEDLSKLLGKLAEKGSTMRREGSFSFFQDLEKMMGSDIDLDDLDLGKFSELFDNFAPPDMDTEFETDTSQGSTKKGTEEESIQEPSTDLFEEEDEILIYIELPGVDQDSITINMEEKRLQIEAPYQNGKYRKRITVPKAASGMPAYSFKNGILQIKFSKGEVQG